MRLGKPGGDQRVVYLAHIGDVNAAIVQPCARSALASKHLVALRIEDHSRDDLPGLFERQRDVIHGEAVREIRGAVQWIDVPTVFGRLAGVAAAFFSDDGMGREMLLQSFNDELFGGAIGLGDQIGLALQLKADMALEEAVQQGSSFARDLRADIEIGRQGVRLPALRTDT